MGMLNRVTSEGRKLASRGGSGARRAPGGKRSGAGRSPKGGSSLGSLGKRFKR